MYRQVREKKENAMQAKVLLCAKMVSTNYCMLVESRSRRSIAVLDHDLRRQNCQMAHELGR
jgi:hypothetical protein